MIRRAVIRNKARKEAYKREQIERRVFKSNLSKAMREAFNILYGKQ